MEDEGRGKYTRRGSTTAFESAFTINAVNVGTVRKNESKMATHFFNIPSGSGGAQRVKLNLETHSRQKQLLLPFQSNQSRGAGGWGGVG